MASVEVLDGLTPNCFRVRQTQAVNELAVLRMLAKVGSSSWERPPKICFPFRTFAFQSQTSSAFGTFSVI